MDIRIVLLPDSKGDDTFRNFSKEICKNYPSLFELGKGCVSHVTLIHAQVDNKDIDEIRDALYAFSRKTNSLLVHFDYSKREVETNNYISIFFKNDKVIVNLRDKIFKELKDYLLSASKFKHPHATLTRLINSDDVDAVLSQVANFSKVEVRLTSLAICEVGENGTCKNIISSYILKQ